MDFESIFYIQGFGLCCQCCGLIEVGCVVVVGVVVIDLDVVFDIDGFVFLVDDVVWLFYVCVYFVFNKLVGYECLCDLQYYVSVFSLLFVLFVVCGVQCVGWFDQDMIGLLLLFDDGQFVYVYMLLKCKVLKIYVVIVCYLFDDM